MAMSFVSVVEVHGQTYDDFVENYENLWELTSHQMEYSQYAKIKELAYTTNSTFHLEYEPTMYERGEWNIYIGKRILLVSTIGTLVANGINTCTHLWQGYDIDEMKEFSTQYLIINSIGAVADLVGIGFIHYGKKQQRKSTLKILPNGLVYQF